MSIQFYLRIVFSFLMSFSSISYSHGSDKIPMILQVEKMGAEMLKSVGGAFAVGFCLTALWDYVQSQKIDRYSQPFSDINECVAYIEDRAKAYSLLLKSDISLVEWLQFRAQLAEHFNKKFSARFIKWFLFSRNLPSEPLVLLHREITAVCYQLFKFLDNYRCNDCGNTLSQQNTSCEQCIAFSDRVGKAFILLNIQAALEKMPQFQNELFKSQQDFNSAQTIKGIAALLCGYLSLEMYHTKRDVAHAIRNWFEKRHVDILLEEISLGTR